MLKRLFFNSDNLLERPKNCVLIRLFAKKRISLALRKLIRIILKHL